MCSGFYHGFLTLKEPDIFQWSCSSFVLMTGRVSRPSKPWKCSSLPASEWHFYLWNSGHSEQLLPLRNTIEFTLYTDIKELFKSVDPTESYESQTDPTTPLRENWKKDDIETICWNMDLWCFHEINTFYHYHHHTENFFSSQRQASWICFSWKCPFVWGIRLAA